MAEDLYMPGKRIRNALGGEGIVLVKAVRPGETVERRIAPVIDLRKILVDIHKIARSLRILRHIAVAGDHHMVAVGIGIAAREHDGVPHAAEGAGAGSAEFAALL